MEDNLLPIIGIGAMLIGTLFLLLSSEREPGQRRRATIVFVMGAAVTVADYFFKNPDALDEAQTQIVGLLLGVLFAFLAALRKRTN